ncbi:hypothetical protein V8E36_005173 [Tilletia maclaganii]
MLALVSAPFWQRLMLVHIFIAVAVLSALSDSHSLTISLQQANHSVFFHANGSLDAVHFAGHTRYIRFSYCLTQQQSHPCRQELLSLYKRESGQLTFQQGALGATPTLTIAVGGQSLSVIFDTAAVMSIIDPVSYSPEQSSTVHDLRIHYTTQLADGRTAEMVRWRDLISIAGLNVLATVDRSEERIFDPTRSTAGGILAFSKHGPTCQSPVPPIYVMRQRQQLDRPIFSFSLPRSQYFGGPLETDGKLTIGGFDRARGLEALRYSPVVAELRFRYLWATPGKINNHPGVMMYVLLKIYIAATTW